MSNTHDDYSRTTVGANNGVGVGQGVGYGAGYGAGHGAGIGQGVGAEAGAPVNIFLRPIAPPAVLGLAAYAGSTWIVSSWLANWWGGADSPYYFFPFVLIWGGLGQFIAGYKGFHARDALVTLFHTLWGSFWLAAGLLWLMNAVGAVPQRSLHAHFAEVASWAVILMVFTWICTIGSFARDMILFSTFLTSAIGSTLWVGGWYAHGGFSTSTTVKAGSYFLMLSSLLAAWRVAAFIFEENFGRSALPIFRTRREQGTASVSAGYGEPGVKRGEPNQPIDNGSSGFRNNNGGGLRKTRPSGETNV